MAEGDTHNSYVSVNCIRFEGMISARAGTPLYLSLCKVTHFLRTALRSGAKYFQRCGENGIKRLGGTLKRCGMLEVGTALEHHAASECGVVELQTRGVQAESSAAASVDVVADDGAAEAFSRRGVYPQLVRTSRKRLK